LPNIHASDAPNEKIGWISTKYQKINRLMVNNASREVARNRQQLPTRQNGGGKMSSCCFDEPALTVDIWRWERIYRAFLEKSIVCGTDSTEIFSSGAD
jgi:hypothetical protein